MESASQDYIIRHRGEPLKGLVSTLNVIDAGVPATYEVRTVVSPLENRQGYHTLTFLERGKEPWGAPTGMRPDSTDFYGTPEEAAKKIKEAHFEWAERAYRALSRSPTSLDQHRVPQA